MLTLASLYEIFIMVCILLYILEFFLAKRHKKAALVLPVVVLCFCVVLGFGAIFISIPMFAIYFLISYFQKKKKEKLDEINKMNIQDLE